jgi:hypothetical protein
MRSKKINCIIIISVLLIFSSCKKENKNRFSLRNSKISTPKLIQEKEKTIKTRFNLPNGFLRVQTKPNSFESYLRNFKLKPDGSKVHLYNGQLKNRQDVHAAILDIDVGKKDLQQCADATMRLRASFLYEQKKYNEIHFKFTNGFEVAYSKWRQGYRLKIIGNNVSWYKTDKESTSYKSFRIYMQYIFMYAGTLSLEKELKKVDIENMKIGDIFIQGGSPGHAIIVVDMAIKNNNEKLFLLAQSYIPAQEIHILKNFNNTTISPWYSLKDVDILKTPEWNFKKENLKRF